MATADMLKMFSVVRSVILDSRECVCVFLCVGSWWGFLFLPPPPPPHGFNLRENSVDGPVTLPSDLRVTLCHPSITPSLSLTHTQSDPGLSDSDGPHAVSSSHDGALLRRSGPGASCEIEGLHVEVKAGRRISC